MQDDSKICKKFGSLSSYQLLINGYYLIFGLIFNFAFLMRRNKIIENKAVRLKKKKHYKYG